MESRFSELEMHQSIYFARSGQLYTGKSVDGPRQRNFVERTVLVLVNCYQGSERNVTTDNFLTTLEPNLSVELLENGSSWNNPGKNGPFQ